MMTAPGGALMIALRLVESGCRRSIDQVGELGIPTAVSRIRSMTIQATQLHKGNGYFDLYLDQDTEYGEV